MVDRLVGKYIPNLTGKPFSISQDYVEEVAMATDSDVLSQLLVDWVRSFLCKWSFFQAFHQLYISSQPWSSAKTYTNELDKNAFPTVSIPQFLWQ